MKNTNLDTEMYPTIEKTFEKLRANLEFKSAKTVHFSNLTSEEGLVKAKLDSNSSDVIDLTKSSVILHNAILSTKLEKLTPVQVGLTQGSTVSPKAYIFKTNYDGKFSVERTLEICLKTDTRNDNLLLKVTKKGTITEREFPAVRVNPYEYFEYYQINFDDDTAETTLTELLIKISRSMITWGEKRFGAI